MTIHGRIVENIANIVSVRGYYSTVDQHNNVIIGTRDGEVHHLFWTAQSSVNFRKLPVAFDRDTIVSVSGHYSADTQHHVAIVGTTNGKVHEIFWKSGQQGIAGHNDLPDVDFPNPIVAVSGHFSVDDPVFQGHIVIVGTKAQNLHEIFWKSGQPGIAGHEDLPVNFSPAVIRSVSSHYSTNDQRHNVIVGKIENTNAAIDWIFWKSSSVGVESHFRLPVNFTPSAIPSVSSYYSADDQRHHIILANKGEIIPGQGNPLVEVFSKPGQQVMEDKRNLPPGDFPPDQIVSVSGHYNVFDQLHNVIVGKTDGNILHIFWKLGE